MIKKTLTLVLIAYSLFSFAQNSINWGMTMNVATSTYDNMHPRVVVNAAGNPLVIWGRMSDQSLYFSRWSGSSFTTPVKLNPAWMTIATQSWQGPDIASKGDTVYVVMKQTPEPDTASHIYLVRSFDGGMTFSNPFRVSFIGDSVCRFPTVTIDPSGNPVVSFMKFDNSFGDARWVVTRSTNYGNTFTTDVKASGWSGPNATVCDCCPGGIATASNKVAMMYRDAYTNIRDSWIGLSVNGGSTFTAGWNMDQNNWMLMMCPSSGPDGVIIGDSLYSVFMNGDSGNDLVYWNTTSLSSMSSPPAVPLAGSVPNLGYQNYPRIDRYGTAVAIVWKQNANGGDELPIRFTNNINTGLPSAYDTVDLANVTNADVALSNGMAFVVWQDDNSNTVRYRSGTYTPFTSVNNLQADELNFTLYPNPNQGSFYFNADQTISEITVLDVLGKTRWTGTLNQKTGKVDLAGFTAGMYIVNAVCGEQLLTKKIVVH